MDKSKEPLRRFTVAHECSHYILHQKYFKRPAVQLNLFDGTDYEVKQHAALKSSEVEEKGRKRVLTTHNDWLEWQANALASHLLMNQSSMDILFREWGEDLKNKSNRRHAINLITTTYGVSYEAAKVRLCLYLGDMNIAI